MTQNAGVHMRGSEHRVWDFKGGVSSQTVSLAYPTQSGCLYTNGYRPAGMEKKQIGSGTERLGKAQWQGSHVESGELAEGLTQKTGQQPYTLQVSLCLDY